MPMPMNQHCINIVESSPASPTNGGYVRVMASIAGKSDEFPMRTLNSRYGGTRM